MKKSVVATSACASLSRYTAASSAVSLPIISWGQAGAGAARLSRPASTPGAILQPQPPPWESDVRRGRALSEESGESAMPPVSPAAQGRAMRAKPGEDDQGVAEGNRSRTCLGAADAPNRV